MKLFLKSPVLTLSEYKEMWKNLSFTVKIALGITLSITLGIGGVTVFSIFRQQQSYKNELEIQGQAMLELLNVLTRDALYTLDADLLSEMMETLGTEGQVIFGRVYDSQGQIIADASDLKLKYTFQSDSWGKKLIDTEQIVQWESEQLLIAKAIRVGNQHLGGIIIGLPIAPLQAKIADVRNQGIVAALITSIIGVSVSYSISRSITQTLEESLIQAKNANTAKSRFLANMSHELRTPLNAILGFSSLMFNDSSLTIEQKKTLKIINNSGEHLLTLINDILEVNKIEAGKSELNLKKFDLYHLLNSLQDMLRLKAQNKQLNLDFKLSLHLPRYIETDQAKLKQILINLLSNAIKFTSQGGVILRVSEQITSPQLHLDTNNLANFAPETSTTLVFEVEDTGTGIDIHELDKLFQPFIQTLAGIKSQEGTGLGLAISRQFVKLMGGDIEVTSTINQGSIFSFTIPVGLIEKINVQPEFDYKCISFVSNPSDYRILIVEDKWENSLLLRSSSIAWP